MQGTCGASSNVRVLTDLDNSTGGRVEYPPLKPFQCALVIDKPFLHSMNTTLWLDSLYVAFTRARAQPDFSIIQHGGLSYGPTQVGGKALYITSSTFVGEGRGSARAILSMEASAKVLIEGMTVSCQAYAFTLTRRVQHA
jgi:hypothetical protein